MPLIIKAAELGAEALEHYAPGTIENGLNLLKIAGEESGFLKGAPLDALNNFIGNAREDLRLSIPEANDASLARTSENTAKGFAFKGSIDQRIENILQGQLPVDYKALVPKDSKVVLFGETHPILESRDELIANMGQFKQMGFTHLAMEALAKKRQPLLDAYLTDSHPNANSEAIAKALKSDFGWNVPSYKNLIDEAKVNEIKVLATDKKFPLSIKLSRDKAGQSKESMLEREEQWAQVIGDKIATEPESRVFMLAGKTHVRIDSTESQSLTSLLNQKELKPFVIDLNAPSKEFYDSNYTEAVQAVGLENERFAVPIIQTGYRPADIIVNLPARPGTSTFKSDWDRPLSYSFSSFLSSFPSPP